MKLKNKIKSIYETIYKVSFIEKPLPKYPFGNKIWATKQEYRSLFEEALIINDESVKVFVDSNDKTKAWFKESFEKTIA